MTLLVAACTSPSSSDSACQPALYATGLPNADGEAATSSNMEVWGLFYPNDPPVAGDPIAIDVGDVWGPGDIEPRRGTKVVWRATGEGAFSVEARGPDGAVVSPFFQERHGGSNWDRPGDEWGTGWEFPESGCWRFSVRRGNETAEIQIEIRT